jgi:EmrB/QacA subfamily drug resistance transporter
MYEHSRRTLTIASLAVLATFLDTTILYVAFPDITETFSGTSASELSWVLNAYTIVFAALLIPAGKLADRVGHRKVFLAGSIVFTVASMACGLAPTAELLIAFRIVQAVGAAALIPSSLALVMHAFAHDQLPRAVAIWGAAGAVAGALGPTLGAAIVEGLGWRWAFFINLPVGIYTVIAGRRDLHESSDPATQVPSAIGVLLIVGAAGLLSYALVGTESVGWLSGRTFGVLVAGLVTLAAFVAHQQRTKAPALDLDLFRIANFRWSIVAMLVFGTAFAALFFGSILFLTDVWGWSVLQAGFGVAPGPIVVGLVAPRAGRLAGRIGQRPLLIIGGVLFAGSGLFRLAMLGPDSDYLADYFPSMILSGFGVAFVFPQLSSVVAQALPPGRAGVGGAVAQAVRQFGGTFGVALTIAFLGTAGTGIAVYDRIWWLVVTGGLATSLLVLPTRTFSAQGNDTGVATAPTPTALGPSPGRREQQPRPRPRMRATRWRSRHQARGSEG